MTSATGKVYLIGAGPGDPGLLTVKGREVLERADVVVYDRLAHPSLLDHAPPAAERVFAGKARGQQELTQDGINALLVECAQAGKLVARLKGGDPVRFRTRGRGGAGAGPRWHPVRGGARRVLGHRRPGLRGHTRHPPKYRRGVHRGQRQRRPVKARIVGALGGTRPLAGGPRRHADDPDGLGLNREDTGVATGSRAFSGYAGCPCAVGHLEPAENDHRNAGDGRRI